jgi:hypothetical protein
VRAWTIDAARKEANRLRVTLDTGTDPREVEREKQAATAIAKAAAAVKALTVGEVWTLYLAERKPHWGDRHCRDHTIMAAAGGEKKARGTRVGNPWCLPAGVVAQIMGHKPSATAEKHYTVRPLDLLRVHHEKIEAWILEQAGIAFVAAAEPGKLRSVA